jgi:hypothetical protein
VEFFLVQLKHNDHEPRLLSREMCPVHFFLKKRTIGKRPGPDFQISGGIKAQALGLHGVIISENPFLVFPAIAVPQLDLGPLEVIKVEALVGGEGRGDGAVGAGVPNLVGPVLATRVLARVGLDDSTVGGGAIEDIEAET